MRFSRQAIKTYLTKQFQGVAGPSGAPGVGIDNGFVFQGCHYLYSNAGGVGYGGYFNTPTGCLDACGTVGTGGVNNGADYALMGAWIPDNGGSGQCTCALHLNFQIDNVVTNYFTNAQGSTTSSQTITYPSNPATTFGPIVAPAIVETIIEPQISITTGLLGILGIVTIGSSTVTNTLSPAITLEPALPALIQPSLDAVDPNDYYQGYCNLPCGGNNQEFCGGQGGYYLVWERQ